MLLIIFLLVREGGPELPSRNSRVGFSGFKDPVPMCFVGAVPA